MPTPSLSLVGCSGSEADKVRTIFVRRSEIMLPFSKVNIFLWGEAMGINIYNTSVAVLTELFILPPGVFLTCAKTFNVGVFT